MKNGRRKERRTARRFQLAWEITATGTDFREAGTLVNLSSTGAFFHLQKEPDLGAALEIEITVPFKKRNRMKYAAKVVRVEDTASGVGVAVRFDNARPVFAEG
ncbi:MAG TPA: PilZ domain-containing protein [Blastocatellia bacterium]|jgi:PilZ domain